MEAGSPHGGQVSHDHIQGLDGLEGDVGQPSRQRLVESLQTHDGHPFDGHFEAAVLPLARNGDLELHLPGQIGRGWDDGKALEVFI